MDTKEPSESENHEPKILAKKTANKASKRVTFDPDSTLLPSYTKIPIAEANETSMKVYLIFLMNLEIKCF